MPEGYFMTCTDLEKECMILLTYYTGVEYLLNSLSISVSKTTVWQK